jgi:hypothetical protein
MTVEFIFPLHDKGHYPVSEQSLIYSESKYIKNIVKEKIYWQYRDLHSSVRLTSIARVPIRRQLVEDSYG